MCRVCSAHVTSCLVVPSSLTIATCRLNFSQFSATLTTDHRHWVSRYARRILGLYDNHQRL